MIKVNDKVTCKVMIPTEENPEINFMGLLIGPRGDTLKCKRRNFFCFELTNDSFYSESTTYPQTQTKLFFLKLRF